MRNSILHSRPSWQRHTLTLAVLAALSMPAFAQTHISLSAQPLAKSLSELAEQSGANIIVSGPLVAGRKAPKLEGDLSVRDALDQLLRGTGLSYKQKDEKTFVIETSTTTNSTSTNTPVLPTIDVADSAQETTGGGLIASSTSTVTKTDTPIAVTPQSIQVVTQTQLRDQGVQSVTEALQGVSGVVVAASSRVTPLIYIGGMQASTMTNGSNDATGANSLGIPIAGVQQVEVIKGADAILAGMMNPSGIVNVVTKQPTADTVREVTAQVGSYGDVMTALDLGGAINSDKTLTYRFVISGERTGETYGGYGGERNIYVAPSLEWKSGTTDILLQYSHNVQHTVPIQATMFYLNGGPIPVSGRTVNSSTALLQDDQLQLTFSKSLNANVEFVSKTAYEKRQIAQSGDTSLPYLYIDTPAETIYTVSGQVTDQYSTDFDNHFKFKADVGPVKQTIVAGVDYNVSWLSEWAGGTVAIAPFPSNNLPAADTPYTYSDSGKSYFNTVYVQDQIVWDRLHIAASFAHGSAWDSTTVRSSQWLPSIGALYQLTDSVAVYGNDLRSFMPRDLPMADGGITPPESGHSIEAGFKLSLLNDDLSVDARAYRTALNNVPVYNYSTFYYEPGGNQVTRGFDVSVKGKLSEGLRVSAGYTYADPQVPLSTESQVAPHSGNVWLYYDMQGERFRGWGGGVGVTASSRVRYTDSTGTSYTVPGQAETDATLWYKTKKWSVTLAVKNLFNRTLYQTIAAPNFTFLEPGRLVYLTGRYDF